jgi:hypothetical protein
VVGVCTPAVPFLADTGNASGLLVLPPVEPARAEVERLRGSGRCDVVVLLAHTGLERDPETGREGASGLPAENWGFRLATGVPEADIVILGTPRRGASARVGKALVTQAGSGRSTWGAWTWCSRGKRREAWTLASSSARVVAVTIHRGGRGDRGDRGTTQAARRHSARWCAGRAKSAPARALTAGHWELIHAPSSRQAYRRLARDPRQSVGAV